MLRCVCSREPDFSITAVVAHGESLKVSFEFHFHVPCLFGFYFIKKYFICVCVHVCVCVFILINYFNKPSPLKSYQVNVFQN